MCKRKDGKLLKVEGFEKVIPYIMLQRNDSLNMIMHEQRCEGLDTFIEKYRNDTGVTLNYMHIIIASVVRLYAMRPNLNRFVVRSKIYQKNQIDVSLTIKKQLKDTGDASTLKMTFTGNENLAEIKEMVDAKIQEAVKPDISNSTEKLAKTLGKIPHFLFRWAMRFLRFMDNHGMLSKKILDASPFHTSVYINNLKSLKTDAIFHHIYNFGTCGLFVSIGKEKNVPVVEDDKIVIGKIMNFGIVMDERFCDGFYFCRSLRYWSDLLLDPSSLLENFDAKNIIVK